MKFKIKDINLLKGRKNQMAISTDTNQYAIL